MLFDNVQIIRLFVCNIRDVKKKLAGIERCLGKIFQYANLFWLSSQWTFEKLI
jgi:hypothetical protein